jgi:2-enoate reductase
VTLLANSKVIEIDSAGVIIEKKDGTKEKISADAVITAFGQCSDNSLGDAVRAKYNIKTTVLGDAERIGKASNAIRTGFYAAMAVE